MSKILITYEKLTITTEVNLFSLRKTFQLLNFEVKEKRTDRVLQSDLCWCDFCLALRPNSIYSASISKLSGNGSFQYIVSLDDDILKLSSNHPECWRSKYTTICLRNAQALLSPNPLIIKDYACKYNLRPILADAHIDKDELKLGKREGKLKIIYPAGADHLPLFMKYIAPILKPLYEEFPNQIDFTTIGVHPDKSLFPEEDSFHYFDSMPYQSYQKFMANNHFDVGIAPLEKDPFQARKYFIKYIEYSKYGIAGLYSDTEPYTFAVRDGDNGILVKDDFTAWLDTFRRILLGSINLENIVRRSQEDIVSNYSVESVAEKMLKQFPELADYIWNHSDINYRRPLIKGMIYKIKDFTIKICFHVKNDGVKYFMIKLKRKWGNIN